MSENSYYMDGSNSTTVSSYNSCIGYPQGCPYINVCSDHGARCDSCGHSKKSYWTPRPYEPYIPYIPYVSYSWGPWTIYPSWGGSNTCMDNLVTSAY